MEPAREHKFLKRVYTDKDFRIACQKYADVDLNNQINFTVKANTNLRALIIGDANTGKSEDFQTLMLAQLNRWYEMRDMETSIRFSRNYPQSVDLMRQHDPNIIMGIIQDEIEETTGQGTATLTRRFVTFLRTARQLRDCILVCNVDLIKKIVKYFSFVLETLSQNYERRFNLCMMYDNAMNPMGCVRIPLHRFTRLRDSYFAWKGEQLVELADKGFGTGAAGALYEDVARVYAKCQEKFPIKPRLEETHVAEVIYTGNFGINTGRYENTVIRLVKEKWEKEMTPKVSMMSVETGRGDVIQAPKIGEAIVAVAGVPSLKRREAWEDGKEAEDYAEKKVLPYLFPVADAIQRIGGRGKPDFVIKQDGTRIITNLKEWQFPDRRTAEVLYYHLKAEFDYYRDEKKLSSDELKIMLLLHEPRRDVWALRFVPDPDNVKREDRQIKGHWVKDVPIGMVKIPISSMQPLGEFVTTCAVK